MAVIFSLLFFYFGLRNPSVVPNYLQSSVELVYNFVYGLIKSNAGEEGLRYFSLVFTVFIFVFFCNLVGMLPLPMSFTPTSHIIVTFVLALFVFLFISVAGILKNGLGFFHIFLPTGTPMWLAPLMVVLESFTYFSRPLSLSIRLTANMVAGHTILAVIAGFVGNGSVVVSSLSFVFVVLLLVFEIFIAMLQAYIFAILTCVYLNDVLVKH